MVMRMPIVYLQFDRVSELRESSAAIGQNDRPGFADRTGKIVLKPQLDRAETIYNGVANVLKGDRK